jgi:uroporphyrinogen decarboxylase
MRQAGRYLPEYRSLRAKSSGFLDMCLTPEKACKITLQPIERFPEIDAAILFADILIIPYALGVPLDFVEKTGPVLTPVDLKDLPVFDKNIFEKKTAPIFETIKKVKPKLKNKSFIGFAGAPWTVATYMLQGQGGKEMAVAKGLAYGNIEGMDRLIKILIESTSHYLIDQVDSGVDMIQIFESWAGVLPEPFFERWCVAPTLEIIKNVKKKHPNIPIFIFPRGASSFYSKYFQGDVLADGINIDTQVNIKEALWGIPKKTVIQGGMDPQLLKAGGITMLQEAQRILTETKDPD